MSNNKFTSIDIETQKVYENEHWNVVLPRGPFSPFHLMVVIKDQSIITFDELHNEQLILLGDCIRHITSRFRDTYSDFLGYNLSSNNGSEKVGQHMKQFHQHIFLRLESEPDSPYVAMANNRKWSTMDTQEWQDQRALLADLYS